MFRKEIKITRKNDSTGFHTNFAKNFWGNFCTCLFLVVIIALYIFTSRIYSYDVLYDHDLILGFNRCFFVPEHGRYIATFINSVCSETMPVFFNIHPNDFNGMITNHLKAFSFLLLVLLLTVSAFLFKKRENSFFKMFFANFASLIFFVSIFVILYSNQYFLSYEFLQNTIFFEYPMAFLFYIPFWSVVIFLYTKKITKIKKSTVFLIFALCFLVGISIEELNFATFVSLSVLSLILFIRRKNFNLEKKNLLFIFYLDLVYAVSLFLYYIKGNDSITDYGAYNFFEYIQNIFPLFAKIFFKLFIIHNSKLLIPIIVVLFLIFKFSKEKESRKFVSIILINIFSIILYHFLTFFMGYSCPGFIDTIFYVTYPKFIMLYKISLIFYLLLSIGYLTDEVLKISLKQQDLLKIIICLSPMLLFNKFTLFIENIKLFTDEQKEYKKYTYIAEKIALKPTYGEYIVLPAELTEKTLRHSIISKEWLFDYYIFLHPKEFSEKKDILFSDDEKIDMSIFSEEELKELKFSNLLKNPLKRLELKTTE